jgi:Bcr/CflA subfamily drug resistance transporter
MLAGVSIYVVSCCLLWHSASIEELLLLRFFQALGASVGSVITQTMIRDVYEGKARHQIFAIVGGAIAFSPAIGPWLGGFISMTFGWKINFIFLAVMGVLLLIHCCLFLPETRPDMHKRQFRCRDFPKLTLSMLTDKTLLLHVLLITACNGIIFGFYGEAPFVFIELMQFSPSEYGLFGIILCTAGLLASYTSHHLNEKLVPQQIIYIGALIAFLGALNLSAYAWIGLFTAKASFTDIGCIVLAIDIVFVGVSLIISNSLSIALGRYKETLGMSGAIFGTLYYMGISALTAMMSYLHNGTALPMPLFFAVLSLCLLLAGKHLYKVSVKSSHVDKSRASCGNKSGL